MGNIAYSLVRVRTQVQTLSNGTQIKTRTESHEWRDAEGRQRTEVWVERDGEMEVQNISIYDPVLHEYIALYPRTQVASVNRMPPPQQYQWRPVDASFQKAMQLESQGTETSHIEFKNESLGIASIDGECVQGGRSTQTIPAGQIGNDAEIQVVSETWVSPRLEMPLKSIVDDPRTGHYVEEVTELHLEAPDPSMFQVPPGYQVFDLTREPAQP